LRWPRGSTRPRTSHAPARCKYGASTLINRAWRARQGRLRRVVAGPRRLDGSTSPR
jgi:hypothetical protein